VAALVLGTATASSAAGARAPRPWVDLGGQPVTASTDPAHPTALTAGLWAVDLGRESDALHFSYDRRIQGSTVHIGAIGSPAGPDGDGLALAATDAAIDDAEGDDCGSDSQTTDSSVPYRVFGAAVVVGDGVDSPDSTCPSADTVAITLTRSSSYNDADLPVALKIVEEAPVSDQGEPLPDSEELAFDVPDPAQPTDGPAGATAFDDAPLVDVGSDAVTIDTTVTEGTELLWRVPVAWGDQLVARADIPAVAGKDAEGLGYPNSYVDLALVEPDRETFAQTVDDVSYGYYGGTERSRLVAGGYPLRYVNRFESDAAPLLPGDEWVSLTVASAPAERSPLDVPIELTLQVTHTDAAAPTYQAAVLAQGGGAGPSGYSADRPFLVGDGRFAAVASGNPVAPPDDADGGWWSPRHGTGLGLAALSLACCVAGAAWLVQRRAA
jgi:hypothetical protein